MSVMSRRSSRGGDSYAAIEAFDTLLDVKIFFGCAAGAESVLIGLLVFGGVSPAGVAKVLRGPDGRVR